MIVVSPEVKVEFEAYSHRIIVPDVPVSIKGSGSQPAHIV